MELISEYFRICFKGSFTFCASDSIIRLIALSIEYWVAAYLSGVPVGVDGAAVGIRKVVGRRRADGQSRIIFTVVSVPAFLTKTTDLC